MVAHLGFIPAEEAFAGIADVDAPLTAGLPDKLQHRTKLFVGHAQRRVVLGTAHGEDREEPPVFQASAIRASRKNRRAWAPSPP